MLSIKSLGAADSALAAYYESLARDDYYENGGEPPGIWHGQLAAGLALHGKVRPGQLAAAFQGCHPITGEALAKNAGSAHKAGWDLTFSAPKSVSLVWALSSDEHQAEIAAAHEAAVARTIAYMERKAFRSRDRTDPGAGRGAILAVVYQHGTSRELDPQLHSHVVVANLGRRIDGSWCALDFDSRWKMAAGALYRAELTSQLRRLGYGIERDGNSFMIQGIGKDITDAFSTRRHQIVEALEQTGHAGAKAASVAALHTRKAKGEVDRQVLIPLWRRQAAEAGLDTQALGRLHENRSSQMNSSSIQVKSSEDIAFDEIVAGLTRGNSTFTRMQLEMTVATAAQGILSANEIESMIHQKIQEKQRDLGPLGLVRLHMPVADSRKDHGVEHYTTREMMEIERSIIDGAQSRKGESRHIVSAAPGLLAYPQLSSEQIQGLRHVTESDHGVSIVRGLAGTGKSTLLAAARVAWTAAGHNVIGCALAGKATDGLEAGSGIRSQTLHSLIAELDAGARLLSANDVLVIDECGMVGSRQLKKIMDHIHESGSKGILVGDPLQLQPVEAGGMFRYLSDELGYAELREIRRQQKAADRHMIRGLLDGNVTDVLDELKQRGMLTIAPGVKSSGFSMKSDEIIMNSSEITIAEKMVDAWWQQRYLMQPGETLMLAGTRSDVYRLNMLAREKLKSAGLLNDETTLEMDRGPRTFGIGERILFTRNDRQQGVKNGQLGTVSEIQCDDESDTTYTITVDGGRTVVVDAMRFRYLEYGYALSVHKAQGATVDNVLVLMSDCMADREWSYVAASRHRKGLQVFVAEEQYDLVVNQMTRSRQKVVASEFQIEQDDEMECY
jgi:Ti-type conjugative transfer relaxase TraA